MIRSSILLLLTLACAGSGDSGTLTDVAAEADLTGTRWTLVSLGGEAVSGDGIFLILEDTAGERRASGNGGCNGFQGSYTREGRSLRFGPMASTRRACPPAVMDREQAFFVALDATREAALRGSELVLSGEEGELAILSGSRE